MTHLATITAAVDAAIASASITSMNEMLVALSDDADLTREQRYTQQQRLRNTIAHHGQQQQAQRAAASAEREARLTQGGSIL